MSKTVKRTIAFILDVFFVGLLSTLLSMSPINVNYDKELDLGLEYQEKVDAWIEETKKLDESSEEYENAYKEYVEISQYYIYENNRLAWLDSTIMTVVILLYYAIIPMFMDGSTLGKRIMKLRVEDLEGKRPKFWQMLVRTVILFEIPLSLLAIICVFTLNKVAFVSVLSVLNILSYVFLIIIGATVIFKSDNRGLHDMLARTNVEERK